MLTDLVFTEGMLCVNFEERTYVNVVTDRGILFFLVFLLCHGYVLGGEVLVGPK